ncbi:hypothetical protein KIH74_04105 [Kineosporia sp. J2-2]|uniref:Uncharacterized protein n=1 Tax=Kineosporia corallincola TaxID=2835133 RepID=A0ABS5TAK8_9ACTN|nr:hypothetical protein [Kineosporia corallincola]MBT0768091.1 hypothetical protein [Kineosporia corallincola]
MNNPMEWVVQDLGPGRIGSFGSVHEALNGEAIHGRVALVQRFTRVRMGGLKRFAGLL